MHDVVRVHPLRTSERADSVGILSGCDDCEFCWVHAFGRGAMDALRGGIFSQREFAVRLHLLVNGAEMAPQP